MKNIETIFAEISGAIEGIFLENVAADEKRGDDYFWKWISTREIAGRLGWSTAKTRYWLKKLESAGEVECRRSSNWCHWTQRDIHGFKQHRFKDYYERV